MNQEARAYEKHGTAATASAVSAFLAWYVDHAEEVERLTGELHKPYDTHVTVKEILEEGLKELQGPPTTSRTPKARAKRPRYGRDSKWNPTGSTESSSSPAESSP